ncbi:MAG: hypothetical protein JNM82_08465, partial [Rhodocyclaceae bacterium]|nr:hypothetical protein [Rhodocyclaceae bacterium]
GAAGSTLSAGAGAQLAGGGIVTDAGSHGFTVSGAGGVGLTNVANNFGGTVTVSAGTVDLVDNNTGLLTVLLAGSGNTTVSSTGAGGVSVSGTSLGSLDVTGTAGISLIGNVGTGAGQTYHSPVTLAADVSLTAPSVAFSGTVNGARTLSIIGDASFAGPVGASSALSSLTVSGTSALNGNSIRTTGNQDYSGAVVLGADTHLTAANIRFASTVDGGYVLQLTGNGRFDAAVGGVTPLASMSVSGTSQIGGGSIATIGTQTFTGGVTLAADTLLTASAAGFGAAVDGAHDLGIFGDAGFAGPVGALTPLSSLAVTGASTFSGGGVTTSGSQTYSGPVTLAANTTLRGTGLQLSGAVDGARDLILDSGAGDIDFGAAVGGTSPLASLTIDDARNVDFAGAVNAGSFTQTAGTGATTLDTAISTSGPGGIAIANHDVFLAPGGLLATAGGPVSLAADGSLGFSGGSIAAGTGAVTFGVMTPGTAMTFGVGPGLNIGAAAMAAVTTASAVRLGNAATGDLLVAAPLANPGATDIVSLVSGGNITQSAPITVTNLRVSAAGDVSLTDAGNGFTKLAAKLTGAGALLDVRTAGSLDIGTVDGVFGINSPGTATATSPDVRIQVGGSLTQSAAIVANELTLRAPAGSITLLHNHGGGPPPDNDVLAVDALALGSVGFMDGNGYKVNGAVGNGLHFDSLGTIDFSALLAGDDVNIDAGSGDLVINSAGAISITGPGRLHGRNISLSTPDTQDITLSGGTVPGISNDVIVNASGNLTIQTRDLHVAGGVSTAGPGQSLRNDAILQAGGTLSITTSGDFTIQGGTVVTTSGAGGNAAGQANAFVQAPNLNISVGGDLLIKGGDIQADSSAGGNTRNDASGILLIGNAKDIRVGGNMVIAGGSSSIFLGSRNSGSALAVLDPEVPMTITTGGSLALIGGSAKPGITSSASIFNAGPITLDVRGRGSFTDTYRATGVHPAGLLLIGGSGSGRFDLNDDPVLANDYPVKYLLSGGSYTVITSLRGGDAYIQSRAPIGIDSSLLGYIFFAINNETQTRGKRSIVDQATPDRSQAGQCK